MNSLLEGPNLMTNNLLQEALGCSLKVKRLTAILGAGGDRVDSKGLFCFNWLFRMCWKALVQQPHKSKAHVEANLLLPPLTKSFHPRL